MAERDTSRPGLIANLVLAALWLGLGIWSVATPGPPLHRLLFVGYVLLAGWFVTIGIRRHRAARRSEAQQRDAEHVGAG